MGKAKVETIRQKSIKELIEKYKKLTEQIFKQVGEPLPDFEDFKDEKDQILTSAETKLYAFIDVRKEALETANNMLLIVNELEMEQNDPEYHKNKTVSSQHTNASSASSQHPSKRNSRK